MLQYSQTLKIQDTTDPEVSNENAVFSADENCLASFTIDGTADDICASDLSYSYSSSALAAYSTGGGSYSNVPVGDYELTITAEDQCGNLGAKTITVSVIDDKAPSAYCTDELIVTLMPSGMGSIWAKDYDLGSTDNCTEELLVTFDAAPEDFDDNEQMVFEFNINDANSGINCGENEFYTDCKHDNRHVFEIF